MLNATPDAYIEFINKELKHTYENIEKVLIEIFFSFGCKRSKNDKKRIKNFDDCFHMGIILKSNRKLTSF